MGDGTAAELIRLKRADAQRRQQMAAERLSGFEIQADRKSYHLWLSLPHHWRSQSFVAAAARRDIALTPSTTFAISPGHAPNAVRSFVRAPPIDLLDFAPWYARRHPRRQRRGFELDGVAPRPLTAIPR